MAKDLYLQAYEDAGLDVIKTSLQILMTGKIEKYGHRNYDDEHKNVCRVLSPHFAGLFADFWNAQEVPKHDIYNAHEGQLHGYDTAIRIADEMHAFLHASDLDFIVEAPNKGQNDAETARAAPPHGEIASEN